MIILLRSIKSLLRSKTFSCQLPQGWWTLWSESFQNLLSRALIFPEKKLLPIHRGLCKHPWLTSCQRSIRIDLVCHLHFAAERFPCGWQNLQRWRVYGWGTHNCNLVMHNFIKNFLFRKISLRSIVFWLHMSAILFFLRENNSSFLLSLGDSLLVLFTRTRRSWIMKIFWSASLWGWFSLHLFFNVTSH